MRFHLIDRIDAHQPARTVRGRKLTSRSETYWDTTPAGPAMPAPLLLEVLCQAGTWLILITTGRRTRAALLSVGAVTFHGRVEPGDVLEVEGVVESMSEEMAVLAGRVTVGARPVLEAREIMCALIDAGELADVEETGRLQRALTREDGAR